MSFIWRCSTGINTQCISAEFTFGFKNVFKNVIMCILLSMSINCKLKNQILTLLGLIFRHIYI